MVALQYGIVVTPIDDPVVCVLQTGHQQVTAVVPAGGGAVTACRTLREQTPTPRLYIMTENFHSQNFPSNHFY